MFARHADRNVGMNGTGMAGSLMYSLRRVSVSAAVEPSLPPS
jgi:hypothetical protein